MSKIHILATKKCFSFRKMNLWFPAKPLHHMHSSWRLSRQDHNSCCYPRERCSKDFQHSCLPHHSLWCHRCRSHWQRTMMVGSFGCSQCLWFDIVGHQQRNQAHQAWMIKNMNYSISVSSICERMKIEIKLKGRWTEKYVTKRAKRYQITEEENICWKMVKEILDCRKEKCVGEWTRNKRSQKREICGRMSQCVTRSLFQFSRREREFLFFNLRLRDENENRYWDNSRENFRELHLLLLYWLIFSKKG